MGVESFKCGLAVVGRMKLSYLEIILFGFHQALVCTNLYHTEVGDREKNLQFI